MIGLDTNVLVRILTADDPVQSQQARLFVESRCTPESPGFVNCVVLSELVWVLERLYRYRRSEIAGAIDGLLASRDLVVEAHDVVHAALAAYRASNCDFVDALIGQINRARGCDATATFDRKAAKLEVFVAVS